MTDDPFRLSELERDALTELANIGVSRAASSLRQMVGRQVFLSVPLVEMINHEQVLRLLGEREIERLIAVAQDFSGGFSCRALLVLPETNALELAKAVTGDLIPVEEMAEFEDEALSETGNIILNACLGAMGNMLDETLATSLPHVLRGDRGDLFLPVNAMAADPLVLLLHINFTVHERDIRGYIALLMDLPSLAALKRHLQIFLDKIMEGA